MKSIKKQFPLKKPCSNCPFRNDEKAISLREGRKEQIISGLLSGQDTTFHCHKTVYRGDDRNFDNYGNYKPKDICQCAGAIAVCQKFGIDTAIVQLAIRLNVIESNHYDNAHNLTIETTDLKINNLSHHSLLP